MKTIARYFLVAIAAIAATSCASIYSSSGYGNDGMYGTHSRTESATTRSYATQESNTATQQLDMELYATPYGQRLLTLALQEQEVEQTEYVRPESYYTYLNIYPYIGAYNPFVYRHWGRPHYNWGRPYRPHHYWGWNSWDYGWNGWYDNYGWNSWYGNYGWNSWNYGWGWNSWNYGWGWNSWNSWNGWYGGWHGSWYGGCYYPMVHRPYRPVQRPRSIVAHTTRASGNVSIGTRQKSGATTGTSTSNRYNRSGSVTTSTSSSSSSSKRPSSSISPTKRPSSSTSSSTSSSARTNSATNSATSGRKTNSLGR